MFHPPLVNILILCLPRTSVQAIWYQTYFVYLTLLFLPNGKILALVLAQLKMEHVFPLDLIQVVVRRSWITGCSTTNPIGGTGMTLPSYSSVSPDSCIVWHISECTIVCSVVINMSCCQMFVIRSRICQIGLWNFEALATSFDVFTSLWTFTQIWGLYDANVCQHVIRNEMRGLYKNSWGVTHWYSLRT